MATLQDAVDLLHGWYPPHTAESWDAVGLVHGDPADQVRKIMFAVDPSPAVAAEAVEWGADLLVVHHPLFLTPVHGFAATTPKGRTLSTLSRGGCALLTAHTNADGAVGGVSEALATALGVGDLEPIVSGPSPLLDKLTVYVPTDAAAPIRAALAESGAGRLGNYEFASFTGQGEGRFRPLEGADPMIGSVGEFEIVQESKIEVILERAIRRQVVSAMLAAHPYEEPAYDVVEVDDAGVTTTGSGRIGTVEQTTLQDFAALVAKALPETSHGVRIAGDPERVVRRVAVCGGAGDFMLDTVRAAGADVYVTSDLRHHRAMEFLEHEGPALIDVAHWAAEAIWLPVVEARLRTATGDTVDTRVSAINTDPWSFHL